jgi:hypothetical protein
MMAVPVMKQASSLLSPLRSRGPATRAEVSERGIRQNHAPRRYYDSSSVTFPILCRKMTYAISIRERVPTLITFTLHRP